MPDPELSPDPDRHRDSALGHYRADDDIVLPPAPGQSTDGELEWNSGQRSQAANDSGSEGGTGKVGLAIGAALLAGAIAIGSWFAISSSSVEQEHPNWQHVAAATEASQSGAAQVVMIDNAGDVQLLPAIEVARQDADRDATRKVRSALARGDLFAATAALQAAQTIPTGDPDLKPPQIQPNSDLEAALKDSGNELFEIQLFDCCDEDGDVVEILVNDAPFATVPILHEGVTLAIPLASGTNTVTVRGVHDGGGGITVSFKTSRGNYFCQSMRVGEDHRMGVIVK